MKYVGRRDRARQNTQTRLKRLSTRFINLTTATIMATIGMGGITPLLLSATANASSAEIVNQSFSTCTTGTSSPTPAMANWSFSGTNCYSTSGAGGSAALKLSDDGNSATLALPLGAGQTANTLSFHLNQVAAGDNSDSYLFLDEYNGATPLGDYDVSAQSDNVISINPATTKLVFTIGNVGGNNLALDDVVVTADGSTPSYTYGATSTLPSTVTKGSQVEYDITTTTTDTSTPQVKAYGSDGGAGGTYEFQDGDGNWHALADPSAGFGPFQLTNGGTTHMRATFSNVGDFTQTLTIKKLDGTVLTTASQPLTVSEPTAPVKAVENITTGAYFDTVQEAVTAANRNDKIDILSGYKFATTVTINKLLTITAEHGVHLNADGLGNAFIVTGGGAGTTFENLSFVAGKGISNDAFIGVQADSVTIKDDVFNAHYAVAADPVTRGIAVSPGVQGVTIENNSFNTIRQPAYLNGKSSGKILNNYINTTRGWWVGSDSNYTFSGNKWNANTPDISINPDGNTTNNYTCSVMAQIKADNNNANIDNKLLPYGDCNLPTAPTDLHIHYQGSAPNLNPASDDNYVVRNVSKNIVLDWTNDATPNVNITGVRTHVEFPGGSKDFYQGTPYTNTDLHPWTDKYGNVGKFANHGEGKYVYTVEVENAKGWSVASAPLTIYYVKNVPSATFTTTPAKFVNGNFQVKITASDDTVLQSVGVDVRQGPNPNAGPAYINAPCVQDSISTTLPAYSDNGSGVTVNYTCTVNTSHLVDGTTYFLRANAGFKEADGQSYGNSNGDYTKDTGKYAQFTYDATPPTLTVTSPDDNSWFGGTTKNTITVQASASDQNGLGAYCVKLSGVNNGSCVPNGYKNSPANGDMSDVTIDTTGLSSGTYTLTVRVTDKAGNPTEITRTINIDNDGPATTITSPSDSSVVNTTNGVAVSGTVDTTDISGVMGVWVHATGGAVVKATVTGNTWTVTLPASQFQDGQSTKIIAYAKDNLKNTGKTTSINVTVDNTPPVAPSILPATGTTASGEGFTITVTPGDTSSVVTTVTDSQGNTYTANLDGSYTIDTTALDYGTVITVTSTATDAAGNTTTSTASYTVNNASMFGGGGTGGLGSVQPASKFKKPTTPPINLGLAYYQAIKGISTVNDNSAGKVKSDTITKLDHPASNVTKTSGFNANWLWLLLLLLIPLAWLASRKAAGGNKA